MIFKTRSKFLACVFEHKILAKCQDCVVLYIYTNNIIVYPKDRPVTTLTAQQHFYHILNVGERS